MENRRFRYSSFHLLPVATPPPSSLLFLEEKRGGAWVTVQSLGLSKREQEGRKRGRRSCRGVTRG